MSDHRPRKRFGQHFLHDPMVVERIIQAIDPQPGEPIVEIGPGEGVLTTRLLAAANRIDAIEIDRDLIDALPARCAAFGELRLHACDALRFDLCGLAPSGIGLRVVGNLPYNISTPLLFRFIAQAGCIRDMHLMVQREVAERITAAPGSKIYGRLSVMVQVHCQAHRLFNVRPGAFRPPPKVDSTVIRILPFRSPPWSVMDHALLDRLVAQAFGQRRKTLSNSLKSALPTSAFAASGIDSGLRAEALAVEDWVRLANAAYDDSETA